MRLLGSTSVYNIVSTKTWQDSSQRRKGSDGEAKRTVPGASKLLRWVKCHEAFKRNISQQL